MRLLGCRLVRCALVAVVACGGSSEPASTPAQLIITGDHQTGVVGKPLGETIGARVIDASGRGVAGARITVEVQGSGSAAGGTTDETGLFRTAWTLGTRVGETQRLVLRVADAPNVAALVSASERADVPTTLRLVGGPVSAQNGAPLSPAIAVSVADQYGNLIVSSGLQVTVSAPGRTLRGAVTSTTDAGGRATFPGLTIVGKAGAAPLTFTAPQLTGTASLTLTAGAPRALEAVSDSTQTSEPSSLGAPLIVRVVDESANPVPGVRGLFTFVALTTSESFVTDAGGFASYSGWRLPGKVGTYLVIAAVDSLPELAFRIIARVGAPAVANPISIPASIEVATSATISVRVVDKYGNPIPFSPVTWTAPIGGGRVSPVSAITDEEGAVSTTVTMPRAAGTTRTRVTLASGVTQDLLITAAAAAPFRMVVSPLRSAIPVGATTTVRATVFDIFDNPVPNVIFGTSTVIRAGLGTVSPTQDTTGIDGTVRFTITGAAIATQQLFNINSLTSGHTDFVTVETTGASLPGLFASAQELTAGATHIFRCTAFAFRSDGSGAAGVPITFSLAPGQGTIFAGGTSYSSTTDPNGYVTVDWLLPSAGSFSMTVSSPTPNLYANPTSCRATAF